MERGGDYALGDAYSDPDSVQKSIPQQSKRFLVFFGLRSRRVGDLGRELS